MNNELWRKAVGVRPIYEVSDRGRVRRLSYVYETSFRGKPVKRPLPEKIFELKSLSSKGYQRINLDGQVLFVHRLVAMTFIPNHLGHAQINHRNGIKTDNRVENLEWCTNQKNRDHAVATNLQPRGSRISKVLTEDDVLKIRSLLKSGVSQRAVGEAFGVCQQTISHVARRSTWTHV